MIEKNDSIKKIILKLTKEIEKRELSFVDLSSYKRNSFHKESNAISTEVFPRGTFYIFAKRVGKYLQRKGFYKFVAFVQKNFLSKQHHYVYQIDDFVKYYGEDFVNNAFSIIYKREPNLPEMNLHLSYLYSGEKSKSEIIVLLRCSPEGRNKAIKILGIKKRFILFKLYSIPKIGYFVKLLYTLLTLPKLIKKINYYDNFAQDIKKNQKQLENHQKQFENHQKQLENHQQLKMDKSELQAPIIPETLEIKAIDFLSDAKANFPYPIKDLSSFDKNELYYSMFESTFYNHEVVLKKQEIYLNYIPPINSNQHLHLDIGCGRGELLTILNKHNYKTVGIDINSLEISYLKKQNFNVYHSDMLDFLETTTEKFSSISALQVIEHIEHKTLKEFIKLAYDKITDNGVIILETINPHNKVAFNSFHMDETHKKPLPPEMVAFMLQYIGFKDIKFLFISPMPEEFRSKSDKRINYHDYAVIGYKK